MQYANRATAFLATALLTIALPGAIPASARTGDAPAAFAGIPGISFQYYEVEGRDEQEIYAALQARGIRSPDGQSATGVTRWGFQFRWGEHRDGNGGCRTYNPRAELIIGVILPRLRDADGLPPRARAWWGRYQRTIERHEAGHARIAWDHRDDFLRAGNGVRCADIKDIGNRVLARITALQQDYDRATEHGRKQDRVD